MSYLGISMRHRSIFRCGPVQVVQARGGDPNDAETLSEALFQRLMASGSLDLELLSSQQGPAQPSASEAVSPAQKAAAQAAIHTLSQAGAKVSSRPADARVTLAAVTNQQI